MRGLDISKSLSIQPHVLSSGFQHWRSFPFVLALRDTTNLWVLCKWDFGGCPLWNGRWMTCPGEMGRRNNFIFPWKSRGTTDIFSVESKSGAMPGCRASHAGLLERAVHGIAHGKQPLGNIMSDDAGENPAKLNWCSCVLSAHGHSATQTCWTPNRWNKG